jgi:hypothetical protein
MFSTTFKENINSIRNNNSTRSNYAKHILETNNTHGTTENTVDITHTTIERKHMNIMEKSHKSTLRNKTNI